MWTKLWETTLAIFIIDRQITRHAKLFRLDSFLRSRPTHKNRVEFLLNSKKKKSVNKNCKRLVIVAAASVVTIAQWYFSRILLFFQICKHVEKTRQMKEACFYVVIHCRNLARFFWS